MDAPSLVQIESFWPDVAAPFDEIIPAGLRLAAAEDEWWGGVDARRRRRIELTRVEGAPSIEELLDEAEHDAFRAGWTPHGPGLYELEDVILALALREGLSAEFLQRWPPDHGAPVETSDMFQNLVRRLLRIGTDPVRLSKRVEVSPAALMTANVLEEEVDLGREEGGLVAPATLGFRLEGAEWTSQEITATHGITAWLREEGTLVHVRMRKVRRA